MEIRLAPINYYEDAETEIKQVLATMGREIMEFLMDAEEYEEILGGE